MFAVLIFGFFQRPFAAQTLPANSAPEAVQNDAAQSPAADANEAAASKLLLVVPFENTSKSPSMEWVGEAFAELLTTSLNGSSIYTIGREERIYVFDHLGIPVNAHLSRATLYRMAEQMDVDYVIFGSYDYSGNIFMAKAQLLDMKKLHLSPLATEAGALPQLLAIQDALAWDMLQLIDPSLSGTKQAFVASTAPIRLDALENYIRGVIATETPERVKRFKEAVRIYPDYTLAIYQLGKTYYDAREYSSAVTWLAKVPKGDPHALEANFYLGLAAYYIGNFERAEEAFNFVSTRLPLTEVYNNLGVAQARRGKKSAATYFEKAVDADPSDADYHFNLALAQLRNGDTANAFKQLHEAENMRPGDSEIKAALESIAPAADSTIRGADPQAGGRLPLERIKRNYDEASFRQLSLAIQRVDETNLARLDPHRHAEKHIERGQDYLKEGFNDAAQKEFKEAITLDPTIPSAHLGMATAETALNNLISAHSEAAAAAKLQPSAEAYIVLARIELKQNNPKAASQDVNQALALEPANTEARSLQQMISAKVAEPVVKTR